MRVVVSRRGNGLEKMEMNRSGLDPERALLHDLTRAVDDDGNDGRLRRDREHERALLERTQVIIASSRPFGTDNDRASALHLLRRRVIRLERGFAIVAIEKDDACALGSESEQRNRAKLGLGDEAAPRNRGCEREDVEPAHMVRNEDRAVRSFENLA